ncbi:MAG: FG-GAP-like repeat-containing protein [Bacteroidota bacterium]
MRFTFSLVSILVLTCFNTFAQTFTVANYLPRNGSFHPADEQIQIAFSEDVDFSTVNKNNIIVKSEIGKTIEGNFSLTSSTNILFSPSDDYPLADVITILVKNDVLSSTGINCEPFTFQFNTAYPESGNSGFSSTPITVRRPSNNNGYTKIADLDGDGDNDIITSGYNTWQDWLENKGNDVFESKSMHNYDSDKPELLEINDIDEDGDVDLVIYDDGRQELYILLNNGTGYFDSKITISTSLTMVTSISINDSDNDGDLDINVSDYSTDAIYSFKNDGNLNFTSTTITNDIKNPTDITLRDANGDGYLDFYVHGGYYGETLVFIYDKSNDVYNKTELIPGFNGWPSPSKLRGRIFVDDYDNDNDLDIITEEVIDIPGSSDVSAIYWYVNDGSNNYSKHKIHEHQEKNIWSFEVLDIEGDGDYDIYVNTYMERGKNLIYYNDGNYTFVKKELPGYPYKRSNVDFGDLDGNGTTDMLSFGGGADVSIAYFKQMDTLNLTTTFPLNNGILEDRNAQIYFEFENTIDPDSFDPSMLIVRSSSGQIKKGTASLDDNRVIFTPDSSFKTGFEIHTYLKRNLKGIDGSSFSGCCTTTFYKS